MRFSDRSTLARTCPAFVRVFIVLAALTACSGPAGTGLKPTPLGALLPKGSASPFALASPVDHHLTNLEFQFCVDTDQVVRREAPLLQPPISDNEAKRRLRQAQVIAETQVDAFANAGYNDYARQMKAWADGFAQGRQMIDNGARPVDALHPAVHAVSILFREIDCEGDR